LYTLHLGKFLGPEGDSVW